MLCVDRTIKAKANPQQPDKHKTYKTAKKIKLRKNKMGDKTSIKLNLKHKCVEWNQH